MQVDFYHLTRDPAEKLAPMLADKTLKVGQRVLIVSHGEAQRQAISASLWAYGATSFLAHDFAGSEQETDQPILISEQCIASNAAKFIVIADGHWRNEALQADRAFYLFTADEITAARSAWRQLSGQQDVTPRYWKQDSGRWVEGP